MARRVCIEPGCPTITDRTRCPEHERAKDKARGTRRERGYDATHDRTRRAILTQINAGERITCWRCGIRLGTDFHLDHTSDRSGYRGPSCPACNLHLAGKAAHGLASLLARTRRRPG